MTQKLTLGIVVVILIAAGVFYIYSSNKNTMQELAPTLGNTQSTATLSGIFDTPKTFKEFFGAPDYQKFLSLAKESGIAQIGGSYDVPKCIYFCRNISASDFKKNFCDGSNNVTCRYTAKVYAASPDRTKILTSIFPVYVDNGHKTVLLYSLDVNTGKSIPILVTENTDGLMGNYADAVISPDKKSIVHDCGPLEQYVPGMASLSLCVYDVESGTDKSVTPTYPFDIVFYSMPTYKGGTGEDIKWIDNKTLNIGLYDASKESPYPFIKREQIVLPN